MKEECPSPDPEALAWSSLVNRVSYGSGQCGHCREHQLDGTYGDRTSAAIVLNTSKQGTTNDRLTLLLCNLCARVYLLSVSGVCSYSCAYDVSVVTYGATVVRLRSIPGKINDCA